MTEQKANEIFKTKYPNGEIYRKNTTSAGNKYWVTFGNGGKVYYYSCTSYAQLLNRLGFDVVYKHDVENAKRCIEKYEKQLEDLKNGKTPLLLVLGNKSREDVIAEMIGDTEKCLNDWKETLRYYNEDCIVD